MTDFSSELTIKYDRGLICPSCGGNCLHQEIARVNFRDEDQLGILYEIDNNGASIKNKTAEGSSIRRDGISIEFQCEDCGSRPNLKIDQHKGKTYIYWQ